MYRMEIWRYYPSVTTFSLKCGTKTLLRPNVSTDFTDGGWNFALMCRRACEYEPLLQLISLNLA